MGFQKGQPRHPDAGRKAGTKNKKTILRVSDVLAAKDLNPTEEILKIIKHLDDIDQIKTWLMLLPYCEPKATESDFAGDPPSSESLLDELREVSDSKLMKVIELKRIKNEEA